MARGFSMVQDFYERQGWRFDPAVTDSVDPVWGLPLIEMTKQIAVIDPRRNRLSGVLLKGALMLAAAAIIVAALRGLQDFGAVLEAQAVAVGIILGLFALYYINSLQSPNYIVWRNRLGVAVIGLAYALLLVASWSLAALLLHALGLTFPRTVNIGDPALQNLKIVVPNSERLAVLLLVLLCPAADQLARRGALWFLRRYVWAFV